MFILKKILNASNNCAEPIRMLTDPEHSYIRGGLLRVSNDGTMVNISSGEMPTHVSLQKLSKNEARTVLCYKITRDMIFEARLNAIPYESLIGKNIEIAIAGGHSIALTGSEVNGVATIYSLGSAINEGDNVLVYFNN